MNYKKKKKSIILIMVLMTLVLCGGAISLGAYHFGKSANAMTKEDSIATAIDKVNTYGHNMGLHIAGGNTLIVQAYYQDAYVFKIGWSKKNLDTDQYSLSTELRLSDQSVRTVYFDDSCKSEVEDAAAIAALEKLFQQIDEYPDEPFMTTAKPIVMRALYVGTDLEQVAEQYYPSDDIWVFASIFPELDGELQAQYENKAYEDDRIDAFAIGLEILKEEAAKTYINQAYEDNRIDFFSVLFDNMNKEEIPVYIKKAYEDNRIDFFAVLTDKISKEEAKTYVSQAYEDNRIDFFAVLASNLSKEEMQKYKEKAYEDDRIDFLALISNTSFRGIR